MKTNIGKIIFWGIFTILAGSYWYIASGQHWMKNFDAQRWLKTTCTITDITVGTEKSLYGSGYKTGPVALYKPIVKYDYLWEGKNYSSDIYNVFFQEATGGILGPGFEKMAKIAQAYTVGETASCLCKSRTSF